MLTYPFYVIAAFYALLTTYSSSSTAAAMRRSPLLHPVWLRLDCLRQALCTFLILLTLLLLSATIAVSS